MSTSHTLLCTALAILLGACAKSDPPAASSAAPAPTTVTAPAAALAAAAPTDAVTGIADCDQFLSAYEQCVTEKVPAQVRDQMQTGINQWKTAWRDMANNAATKDSLPQICQQARASSKPALDAYGCSI